MKATLKGPSKILGSKAQGQVSKCFGPNVLGGPRELSPNNVMNIYVCILHFSRIIFVYKISLLQIPKDVSTSSMRKFKINKIEINY